MIIVSGEFPRNSGTDADGVAKTERSIISAFWYCAAEPTPSRS